jgi:hypothetical protein
VPLRVDMDSHTLTDCAALLERDLAEVEDLHDSAQLIPALLARIGLLMLAERKDAPQRDAGQAWCTAVDAGWGGQEFTSAELLEWAEKRATPQRRDVLAASRELCNLTSAAGLTSHQLGIALRELADAPGRGRWRLVLHSQRRGTNVWALRGSRG